MEWYRSGARLRRASAWFSSVMLAIWLVGCASNTHPAASPGSTFSQSHVNWTRPATDPITAYAIRYVNSMSLDDKIGQVFYAQIFSGYYSGDMVTAIRNFQPGGMIFYDAQLNPNTAPTLMANIQHDSKIPMLLGADLEGGSVFRSDITPRPPSPYSIGATNNAQYAYQQGTLMAGYTTQLGLNNDLAPIVDVKLGCQAPYYSCPTDRNFGATADQVTKMAGAWGHGLQDHGVVVTIKHFPGWSTDSDPHAALPVIPSTLDHLEKVDFAPYRALLNGPNAFDMVMPTDIVVPALDPTTPAELSPKVITGVLRDELHFDGVALTDSLYMGGVAQYMCGVDDVPAASCCPGSNGDLHATCYSRQDSVLARVIVKALQAGDDMVLGTFDIENMLATRNAIKAAIQDGSLPLTRINDSVRRILTLKIRNHLMPFDPNPQPGAPAPQFTLSGAALVEHDRAGM